MDSDLAVVGW